VELGSLDLNLLVALDALLNERSVTRAGARVHVSQPAMSASLRRLRRHFNDLLLERVGGHYELTQLARSMVPKVAQTIHLAEETFGIGVDFDPTTSTRQFEVIASDYAISLLGAQIVNLTAEQAPNVRLNFETVRAEFVDHADEVLRSSADILLLPRGYLSGLPSEDLFHDRFVIVSWLGNNALSEPLIVDDLAKHLWVTPFGYKPLVAMPERFLGLLGYERRSDVAVANLASVPWLVSRTERLAIIPERLARVMAPVADLRIHDSPIELPRLHEAAYWHPSHDDAGNQWLRTVLAEAAVCLEPLSEQDAAHRSR
jgi:DNA-binding transcriptional LysR family regulator